MGSELINMPIEDPSQLDVPGTVKFLGGLGSGLVVGWHWIRSLKQDKADAREDLKVERERNAAYGDMILSVAAETKIHLESATNAAHDIAEKSIDEHRQTRELITKNTDELKTIVSK